MTTPTRVHHSVTVGVEPDGMQRVHGFTTRLTEKGEEDGDSEWLWWPLADQYQRWKNEEFIKWATS